MILPTFLGQKDRYLLGLSLPELIVAMLIAGGWFVVTLGFPLGILLRLVVVLPLTGVSVAFLFVRISGLSIPMYLLLSLLRLFRRPSFEESRELLLEGEPAWLELRRQQQEGGRSRFGFLRRGRKAMTIPEGPAGGTQGGHGPPDYRGSGCRRTVGDGRHPFHRQGTLDVSLHPSFSGPPRRRRVLPC